MRVDVLACEEYVQGILPQKRMKHTIGVRDMAFKLAQHYGCDTEKAQVAALLHDVGKYLHKEEMIDIINLKDEYKKRVADIDYRIYHGYASAVMAERDLNVEDSEILDAIKYHTTGREDMSLLEKIIFIADYIEPNRNFSEVEEVRNMAFEDLDRSILSAMNNTIRFIVDNGGIVDIDTILARNYFLMEWGK